jgi:DNA (cytosine-5)-methyltransferase 1
MITFGSVCSGIEAASVAWHPLGWRAAWLAEIEPFPSAVLAHRYPEVPNLGDMTALPDRIRSGEVEAPDLFCGGTPCQAFSVAGLRRSLDDARGNLSLTFCEIADAIDSVRLAAGKPASIIFWENVPGVLSTADNAFGCFLAGLAGEDDPLVPPGGKWTNAGCVLGPQRAVAWRVLDAQYFGVAQRRRRVFVVASARADFDPAAVLFEFDGLRRDTAPSREAGEGAAPCVTAGAANGGAAHGARSGSAKDNLIVPVASMCLNAKGGAGRLDAESETLIPTIGGGFDVAHSLRGEGFDASEDGTGRGTPLVPVIHADLMPTMTAGPSTKAGHNARSGHCKDAYIVPVAFQEIADCLTSAYGTKWNGNASATNGSLFAFHPTQDPISSSDGGTHAMGCGSSGGQASVAVAFPIISDADRSDSSARTPSPDAEGRVRLRDPGLGIGKDGDPMFTLQATKPHAVATPMQVRRLTPVECERLQGFPDNYTAIPWRKKPASECPDGPRYKALGNSWAVPVVRWIGRRIAAAVGQ